MKRATWILMAAALLLGGLQREASADVVTFSGQDDGAAITGPFPNSSTAQTNFLSAAGALGNTSTITFEDQPLGYNANFTAAPGVTVALTGPNDGDQFSGISNSTQGNIYGFNTTPGGSQWLGFPGGTATFDFTNPTQSFGFWLTGVQTAFTTAITVSFSIGSGLPQVLNAPVNVNGGAAYFGFTDAGASISSITISNLSDDAWGIDDVSYNSPAVSATPEPASLTLASMGLVGLLGYARRRRQQGAV